MKFLKRGYLHIRLIIGNLRTIISFYVKQLRTRGASKISSDRGTTISGKSAKTTSNNSLLYHAYLTEKILLTPNKKAQKSQLQSPMSLLTGGLLK